jgi:hypothetical protein
VDAGRNVSAGARGEAYLVVDGDQRPILFTNRALADAERLTGKTVLQLMRGVQNNEISMSDVVQILLVGMEHARRETRTGGPAYSIRDAWAVMDACGFGTVTARVMEAVSAVMAYEGGKAADESPPLGTGSVS